MEKLIKYEYSKFNDTKDKIINDDLEKGWTIKTIIPLRISGDATYDAISPCLIVLHKDGF